MMRKCVVIGVALTAVAGTLATPIQAQAGWGADGRGGPFMGRSVEMALEHQAELGLDRDQVAKLQDMKGVLDGQVTPLAEEMKLLREKVRSGELDRAEGFREMEALRGKLITAAAPLQGRVQEVFTVAQHRQLQAMVQAGRPGMGRGGAFLGRGGARMAPGVRQGGAGGAGLRPGIRGGGQLPAVGARRGIGGAALAARARGLRSWRGIGG